MTIPKPSPHSTKKLLPKGPQGPQGNSFFVLIVEKYDYLPAPLKKIRLFLLFSTYYHFLTLFKKFYFFEWSKIFRGFLSFSKGSGT